MSATRRGFLQGLLGGVAAVVASPALPTSAKWTPVPMFVPMIASGSSVDLAPQWQRLIGDQHAAALHHAELIDGALFRRLT